MVGWENARNVTGEMSVKIDKSMLDTIVHMTASVVPGKPLNTENDTQKKILSKMVRELWSTTQSETVDWTKIAAVRYAVNKHGYMDITTITHDQWLSDGYVPPVTTNGTENTAKD